MAYSRVVVHPARRGLTGGVPVVADPDIVERVLLLAALGSGESTLELPYPCPSIEVARLLLGQLGVESGWRDDSLWVKGVGLHGLTPPKDALNSAGAPVLLDGLLGCLAAQAFDTLLGPSVPGPYTQLQQAALVARGASLSPGEEVWSISGRPKRLAPIELDLPPGFPLVKHMLLLSGLFAEGPTILHESLSSVDHTERLLAELGIPITTSGPGVSLHPPRDPHAIKPFVFQAPGSPAAACLLLALGATIPDSHLTVRGVSRNPSRDVLEAALGAAGVRFAVLQGGDALGEPFAEISCLASAAPRAIKLGGELGARLGDELYGLTALGSRAAGTSSFSDLGPCHDPSQVAKIAGLLRSFGLEARVESGNLTVEGRPDAPLRATRLTTGGDARLATLGVVLGLMGDAPTEIDDVDCVLEFFPRFFGTLRALGARVEVLS